jgi:23S rRNA pseudouridine1911/1915/1917 synthase
VKAALTGDQPPRPGVIRYLVTPDLAGRRLDQGLAALAGVPRRRVRALVGEGRLWLNGRATRVLSRLLHLADVLDVVPEGVELGAPRLLPPPLSILHQDGWLLAVDKPAGVTTQPPRKRAPGEFTAHEMALLQLAFVEGKRVDLRLFHRLDRLTTGVLVFARQHEAARALARIWGSGSVRKRYVALVRGSPGAGVRTLAGPIAPDPLVPGRFRIARGGKPARTEVRLIATSGEFSLIEVRPATGRTHQVRVHLAEAGCPVAGDTLYGGGGGVPRPLLHAWRLSLPHPRTGQLLHLTAPIPADMQACLAGLGFAPDLLST